MATILLVVIAMAKALSGVHAEFTTNLTADEWAYTTAVRAGMTPVMDTAALNGLGSGGNKWEGIALAANVGKLYAAPFLQAQC